MSLREKLLAARERWMEVGGFRLKVRRPSDLELLELSGKSTEEIARKFAMDCVVDWTLTEADVLPGVGGNGRAEFDAELYRDWVADRIEVLREVANTVAAMISERRQRKEESEGKS